MRFARVYFRGGYGLRNFGDDLLFLGVCRWIECHTLQEIAYFDCLDAEYLSLLAPFYRHSSIGNAQMDDLVLYAGGTQFYSFPLQLNARERLRKLLQTLRYAASLTTAQFQGPIRSKRSGFAQGAIGIGAGPFFSPRIKRETARLFRGFELLWTRDTITTKFARSWQIRDSRQGADIVYAIADELRSMAPFKETSRETLGFIPRFWPHAERGESHFSSMLQAARKLRQKGQNVEFMFLSDLRDAEEIRKAKRAGFETHVWNPDVMEISDFLAVFQRMTTIVTARYHGAIVSAILGIPFICCDIEPKLSEVMTSSLGGNVRVWHPPYAYAALEELLDMGGDTSELIDAVDEEVAKAKEMFADLARFLMTGETHLFEPQSTTG